MSSTLTHVTQCILASELKQKSQLLLSVCTETSQSDNWVQVCVCDQSSVDGSKSIKPLNQILYTKYLYQNLIPFGEILNKSVLLPPD